MAGSILDRYGSQSESLLSTLQNYYFMHKNVSIYSLLLNTLIKDGSKCIIFDQESQKTSGQHWSAPLEDFHTKLKTAKLSDYLEQISSKWLKVNKNFKYFP